MNARPSGEEAPSADDGMGRVRHGLRRTYRFPDGVRVMVWAYDVVVWIYPDGRRVKSECVARCS